MVSDDIVARLRSEWRMAMAPLNMSDAADEIERLRHQLQGVWAIANLLATRLENVSSGNAAVLHQFDRAVEKARLFAESDAGREARRGE